MRRTTVPFNKTGDTHLVIGPLDMNVLRGTMPPDEIKLWDGNPRIRHLLSGLPQYPGEEDLISLIQRVQRTAYNNLYKDIERFGQQEPVFLRTTDPDGHIETATALEGNTRVAILKQLRVKHPANPKYQLVQAYVLPASFSENDLAILMANFHVKGTLRNQWDRYQIGAFLYDEIEVKKRFTQQDMAASMGKSPSWVSQRLTVFKFVLDFQDELQGTYDLSEGDAEAETNDKFSLVEEAWKVKRFRDRIEDPNTDAKETLFRWVHQNKFKDHRAIRKIDDIYSNPKLRAQVDKGDVGAGDTAADRLERAQPLHAELDKVLAMLDAITIGDITNIDSKRVAKTIVALRELESMIERLGGTG
jgi:hypothetical protein